MNYELPEYEYFEVKINESGESKTQLVMLMLLIKNNDDPKFEESYSTNPPKVNALVLIMLKTTLEMSEVRLDIVDRIYST